MVLLLTALSVFAGCERLIKKAHEMVGDSNNSTRKIIDIRAEIEVSNQYNPWRELRHVLGRLNSYRQAGDVLIRARRDLPKLFENIKVEFLSSSTRDERPIPLSDKLTADSIIQKTFETEDGTSVNGSPDQYLAQAKYLQVYSLDKHISAQNSKSSFQPLVHPEVLLHWDRMMDNRGEEDFTRRFWRGWRYIGTSKGLCRLCAHYFDYYSGSEYEVGVRASHGNLYKNWRLPNVFEEDDPRFVTERRDVMRAISGSLRSELYHVLLTRVARYKTHDSTTYSEVPPNTNGSSSSTTSYDDLASGISRLNLTSSRTSVLRTSSTLGSGGFYHGRDRDEVGEASVGYGERDRHDGDGKFHFGLRR